MTLHEFLLKLARDETFRKDFIAEPESFLNEHGLSGPKVDAVLEILRSGKLHEVRAIVEARFEFDGEMLVISSVDEVFSHVYCSPPGDD